MYDVAGEVDVIADGAGRFDDGTGPDRVEDDGNLEPSPALRVGFLVDVVGLRARPDHRNALVTTPKERPMVRLVRLWRHESEEVPDPCALVPLPLTPLIDSGRA